MEFLIGSSLRFAWQAFARRPWLYVGATLLIFIAYVVSGLIADVIDNSVGGTPDQPTLLGTAVSVVLGSFVSMCSTAFYLAAHDNPDTVDISSLWHTRQFWKYLLAYLLVWLGFVIGLVLLVVPGVIFGLMFIFTTYIVVDRGLGPIEAMKESYRITLGYKWDLFGLSYVLIVVTVLGLLAVIVGIFVTVPLAMLSFVHAYRVLSGRKGPSSLAADERLAA